jgi:transcriptional regulator with XRE-family HTH domain
MSEPILTSELIRAARALLRWDQRRLAEASSVSLPTVKRLESRPGILGAHSLTLVSLKRALEKAGVEFTNGDQPGVRSRSANQGGQITKLARSIRRKSRIQKRRG